MKFKVLVSCAMVFVAMAGSAVFFKHSGATFERLAEAKARISELGYFCTTDSESGQIGCGFLISRTTIDWSQTGLLRKTGPMGPEWQGKVWVTLNPRFWRLEAVPDQAGVRVWGSVIAFGDEDFLEEIESSLESL